MKGNMATLALDDPHLSDAYEFTTDDYNAYTNAVEHMEANSEWIHGIVSKSITLESIDGPLMAEDMAQKTNCSVEAVFDTATEGTSLIVQTDSGNFCLRECARKSMMNVAKVDGSAFGRMSPYQFKECINWPFQVARGETTVLYRYGKAAALLSNGYEIMSIPELLQITKDTLIKNFGNIKFVGGYLSHSFADASWELTDAKPAIMQIYQDAINNTAGAKTQHALDFVPVARFYSSDTGHSCATLMPEFRAPNGISFRLTDGISVKHEKNEKKSGIDRYAELIQGLYAQFAAAGKKISELAVIPVHHPCNAAILLCKKFGIPKRYGERAREELEMFTYGGASLSAHDVYLGMHMAIVEAKQQNATRTTITKLEESVARVLTVDWRDYDVGGNVSWNGKD